MTNKTINFKQERDFGELFNAAFGFITQEFKRLGTALLYFVVPALILSSIASTIYSVKSQEITRAMTEAGNSDPMAVFSVMGDLFGYIGLMSILMLVSISLMTATVLCYIQLYIANGPDEFTLSDLWREVMKNIGRVFVAMLVVGILTGIGFAFCLIPGIYLGVALSLIVCIMIFEGLGFSQAFSRSFKLVNPNWWFALGVIVVTMIIYYVLSILVSIPGMIMGFKSLFTNLRSGGPGGMTFSTGFYIVNSITSLISYFFMVIMVVITAFLYYSFVEKHEKPSLMGKVEQLGEHE